MLPVSIRFAPRAEEGWSLQWKREEISGQSWRKKVKGGKLSGQQISRLGAFL